MQPIYYIIMFFSQVFHFHTSVDRLLEVDVLVVVVVIVWVDVVVDVGDGVEDGEGHAGKHERDQLNQLRPSFTMEYFYLFGNSSKKKIMLPLLQVGYNLSRTLVNWQFMKTCMAWMTWILVYSYIYIICYIFIIFHFSQVHLKLVCVLTGGLTLIDTTTT